MQNHPLVKTDERVNLLNTDINMKKALRYIPFIIVIVAIFALTVCLLIPEIDQVWNQELN